MAPYMSHKKMFWCLKNVDVASLDTYLSKLIYMILWYFMCSSNIIQLQIFLEPALKSNSSWGPTNHLEPTSDLRIYGYLFMEYLFMDIYRYIFILVYPQFSSIFSYFHICSIVFPMEITHPAMRGPWVAMETEVDTGGQGVGPSRGAFPSNLQL